MADIDAVGARVPVTVLTGFLGSGKTTLFNHILTASHGKKIAVIQNEYGEVGVDNKLMAKNTKFQLDEEIVETLNGCVCCSVRTDLIEVLQKLAERCASGKLFLDAIVIETTGLADPAPVAQTFLVEESLKAFARLDGIVTVVDAKHIEQHLDEQKAEGVVNEAVSQVAFADRLLLNKVDLVPDETSLKRIEARLRGINAYAPLVRTAHSQISVEQVLNIHGFDLQRALKSTPDLLDVHRPRTKHDAAVSSHSIDQSAARHLRRVNKGQLDLALVEEWIGDLLAVKGEELYRMKGVLAIAHSPQRFVFHAVHMTIQGSFDEVWGEDEPQESKLVFIGKDLDVAELDKGFNDCLATPENMQGRISRLRFAVGDKVECNLNAALGWRQGVVAEHMYREEGMPPGLVAPYRIELDSGELVYASSDSDCAVRAPRRRSPRLKGSGRGADEADCGHDHGHDDAEHARVLAQHQHEHPPAAGHDHGHDRSTRSRRQRTA